MLTKEIDSEVEVVHDRILVLLLRAEGCSICMINVYMPCRGLSNFDSDFRETLDQIQEVISKFCHSHNVILLGDLNASLTREEPSSRDKILRKFCKSQQLFLCEDYPVVSTFIHPSGKSQSQVDYILCMGDPRRSLVSGV